MSPGDRGGGAPGFRRRAGGRIRRTEPRFTRDIDLVVAVGDDTEAFVAALIADGHELVASVEHEAVRRLAMARLRLRDGSPLDLLFASSGIEPEIANAAEVLEVLPGFSVPVITTGHLIAVKILARDDHARPQDIADLRRLLAVASPEDLAVAHEAVALISERGFGAIAKLVRGVRVCARAAIGARSTRVSGPCPRALTSTVASVSPCATWVRSGQVWRES